MVLTHGACHGLCQSVEGEHELVVGWSRHVWCYLCECGARRDLIPDTRMQLLNNNNNKSALVKTSQHKAWVPILYQRASTKT